MTPTHWCGKCSTWRYGECGQSGCPLTQPPPRDPMSEPRPTPAPMEAVRAFLHAIPVQQMPDWLIPLVEDLARSTGFAYELDALDSGLPMDPAKRPTEDEMLASLNESLRKARSRDGEQETQADQQAAPREDGDAEPASGSGSQSATPTGPEDSRQALIAALAPPPPAARTASALAAPTDAGCINCGEKEDGGFYTDEGEVGSFCEQCWEMLREQFAALPASAPAAPVLTHFIVAGGKLACGNETHETKCCTHTLAHVDCPDCLAAAPLAPALPEKE